MSFLNAYGAKGIISPRTHALIQKDYDFMYSGSRRSFYNICWFAISVYYNHYVINKNKKILISENEVKLKKNLYIRT
jgi:hypothetical protein